MKTESFLNSRILGFLYVFLAGIGFGFLGIFAKWGYRLELSVGEILTWRFLSAAIILGLYLVFFKLNDLLISKAQLLISLLLGIMGYAVFSTLYFKSIQGISVALAAMILFTFPIFVTLGAWIFQKEKISFKKILSLFTVVVGILILLWGPIVVQTAWSIGFAFCASLTYAAYVLFSSKYQKNINPMVSSFYVMLAAAVTLLLFHKPDFHRLFEMNLSHYSVFIGLALISSIMPLSFFLAGLQKLKSYEASIAITIEPVVAALAAFLILGETLSIQQGLGALVVIIGLALNAISK